MTNKLKLLYLGFAFPPGLISLHPGINPAGHGFETRLVRSLKNEIEVRTAGTLPFSVKNLPRDADPSSGTAHEVLLVEKSPEAWHRNVSLHTLKSRYRDWQAQGWVPDVVMSYNLTPVYNAFFRWLSKQPSRPRLVLMLLDSAQLGKPVSPWKRFRYKFKPMVFSDEEMLGYFDGCIAMSIATRQYFERFKSPFLWMPGACDPSRAPAIAPPQSGPIRFGYFGALASHAGVLEMARVFMDSPGDSELHIAGYGKLSGEFEELARANKRLKFHGWLKTADDCLKLGCDCDVLINPRPADHGNQNNMASKLFDYALCKRAIITSRISGADEVLGSEAYYMDPLNFESSLRKILAEIAATPRPDLWRKGEAISNRVISEFNWTRQAGRIAAFLKERL